MLTKTKTGGRGLNYNAVVCLPSRCVRKKEIRYIDDNNSRVDK